MGCKPQVICTLLWTWAALASVAPAATINVPADYSAIQDAINAANPNDEIIVAPGTYIETIDFNGKAVTLRSSGGAEVTTIDANGIINSMVKCINGEGPDTVLEGFTIAGGIATLGGGMRNEGSSPTVTNCTFTGNIATDRGGGMYNFNSDPTVTNCTFFDNFASFMGGGMFNIESSPTITNCTFSQNICDDDGGGMRNYIDSHPTITNCTFIGNVALDEGGGMGNRKNSNPTIINCTFLGNSAVVGGAGMDNHVGAAVVTGVPKIIDCLFAGNEGEGMRNNDPAPVVTNCVLVANTGVGMFNRAGAEPLLTNCIL